WWTSAGPGCSASTRRSSSGTTCSPSRPSSSACSDDHGRQTTAGSMPVVVRGPSSVVRRPWSVVRGPSSVVRRPWSVVSLPEVEVDGEGEEGGRREVARLEGARDRGVDEGAGVGEEEAAAVEAERAREEPGVEVGDRQDAGGGREDGAGGLGRLRVHEVGVGAGEGGRGRLPALDGVDPHAGPLAPPPQRDVGVRVLGVVEEVVAEEDEDEDGAGAVFEDGVVGLAGVVGRDVAGGLGDELAVEVEALLVAAGRAEGEEEAGEGEQGRPERPRG